MVWIKVAEVEKHIDSFCVQKLMANAQYVFRIMAMNSIGVSEPIESEPITIKIKIGKLYEVMCRIFNDLCLLVESIYFIVLITFFITLHIKTLLTYIIYQGIFKLLKGSAGLWLE